jgi:O-antigen/teichoic acid export membrane protein
MTEETTPIEIPETGQTRSSIFVRMVFGFCSWVLPGLLVVFSTPIVVKALGADDYGIYALIFGLISYSLSFSLSRSVTKYVSEYKPLGDHEKINDVISATFFLSLLFGLGAAAILSGGAGWLVRDVFHIDSDAQARSIYSFYLAGGFLFFYMIWQVFAAVLTGLHRFDYFSYISIIYGVMLTGGSIVAALMGFGLIGLFWWSLITNIVVSIIAYWMAKALYPEMRIRLNFQRKTMILVAKYSSAVILTQIFANVLLQFERGLITRNLGSKELTYYVIPMTLAMYIHSFIGSFTFVIFPITSEIGGQRDKQIVLYRRASKMVVTLVVFIAVTMLAAGSTFLTQWVGPEIARHSAPLLIIQVIIFSLLAVHGIMWQLAEALGHPRYNTWLVLSWLLTGGALMYFLINDWGGAGVAAGRMIAMLNIPIAIMYGEHWFLGAIQWKFWARLLPVLAVGGSLTWLANYLILGSTGGSWLILFVAGGAGTLVFALVLFLFGWFTQDERLLISRLLMTERSA